MPTETKEEQPKEITQRDNVAECPVTESDSLSTMPAIKAPNANESPTR
ncbi:MAG: hypothetical protein R2867_44500 [Caldilineaceae bacterium]